MIKMISLLTGLIALSITGLAYSSSGPMIVINTPQDLENINQNLAGNYILGQDIDLRNFPFTPLGSMNQPFTGSLNGNGHQISNLNLNLRAYDVGLFAKLGASAKIANLTVTHANVTGWNTTGIIVAENSGSLINVAVNGNVAGYDNVGGLVGANNGGKIYDSHAEVTVNPSGDFAGVLVGGNAGLIQNSYAIGSVIAPNSNHIGGLVGDNGEEGIINASYAEGSVAGADNVGGLSGGNAAGAFNNDYAAVAVKANGQFVGGLSGDNVEGGTIENCYSMGDVVGSADPEYVGGLIGYNEATVIDSYWDIDTSGQTRSAGGAGESDAAMQNQATYQNWDFNAIWQMQTYPVLRP